MNLAIINNNKGAGLPTIMIMMTALTISLTSIFQQLQNSFKVQNNVRDDSDYGKVKALIEQIFSIDEFCTYAFRPGGAAAPVIDHVGKTINGVDVADINIALAHPSGISVAANSAIDNWRINSVQITDLVLDQVVNYYGTPKNWVAAPMVISATRIDAAIGGGSSNTGGSNTRTYQTTLHFATDTDDLEFFACAGKRSRIMACINAGGDFGPMVGKPNCRLRHMVIHQTTNGINELPAVTGMVIQKKLHIPNNDIRISGTIKTYDGTAKVCQEDGTDCPTFQPEYLNCTTATRVGNPVDCTTSSATTQLRCADDAATTGKNLVGHTITPVRNNNTMDLDIDAYAVPTDAIRIQYSTQQACPSSNEGRYNLAIRCCDFRVSGEANKPSSGGPTVFQPAI